MTTTTVVTMIVILGFVWGGLAVLITIAARKESLKGEVEGSEGS